MSSQVRSHLGSASTNKTEDETLEQTRLPIPIAVRIPRIQLSRYQIMKLLEEENLGEFEPGQVYNLPYNTTK